MQADLLAVSLVVVSSVIGAFGGFIFKRASSNLSLLNISSLVKNYLLIAGFALFALASITYIIALKYEALNVLYPISALTYIWSSLIARKYLGEKINLYKWGGIALIIIGAFFIVN